MNLHKYLKDKRISRDDFARALGVHPFTIQQLCAPEPRPCGGPLALQIHEATNGEVPLASLLNPQPCPLRRP